jgi:hypothetical protein
VAASDQGFPGYCGGTTKRAIPCWDEVCTGDKAFCAFDVSDRNPKRHACGEDRDGQGVIGIACTSPQDCSGYPCWETITEGKSRAFRCGDLLRGGRDAVGALCKQVADCPAIEGPGAHPLTRKARACRPDANLPPGVMRCSYPPR